MNKATFTSLICMLLLTCTPLLAQPPIGNPDQEVPIDGGASLLAAAGIAYGAKKLFDSRKEKQQEDID
jgi:hypothetical protein